MQCCFNPSSLIESTLALKSYAVFTISALKSWSFLENRTKFYLTTLALFFSETIEDIKTLSTLSEIHLTALGF